MDPTMRKGVHVEFKNIGPLHTFDTGIHGQNSREEYPEFVEEISGALRRVKTNEFTILPGDV